MASTTKVIGLRVPVALAAEWEKAAENAGIAVGALVIDLAKRGARLSAIPIKPVLTRIVPSNDVEAKPVTALNLPVLTDFPKRDATKNPKKGKAKR